MRCSIVAALVVACILSPGLASAITTGTDIFVPAAARGAGTGDSVWVTDLYVYNPGSEGVSVDLYWLARGRDNSEVSPETYDVDGGETLVLHDVILNVFGHSSAGGAFRLVATAEMMVHSRIYNQASGDTFGQGFEGVPVSAAIPAGSSTDFVGAADTGDAPGTSRTNIFAVNTGSDSATVTFSLLDTDGSQLASRSYTLNPYAALYKPISDLGGGPFGEGTVHAEVSNGSVIVVGSRIDNGSGDPTTLESWWSCGGGEPGADGVYVGYHQYTYEGGLRMVVEDGALTTVQGSLVLYSPYDGGANCGDLFPFLFEAETPWAIDPEGSFAASLAVEYADGTVLEAVYEGVAQQNALLGTVDVSLSGAPPGECAGQMNTADFFAGRVPLAAVR